MKRLWAVTAEIEYYVAAENPEDARRLAEESIYSVASKLDPLDLNLAPTNGVFPSWLDLHPFGDTEKTCREYLEEAKSAEERARYIQTHYKPLPETEAGDGNGNGRKNPGERPLYCRLPVLRKSAACRGSS